MRSCISVEDHEVIVNVRRNKYLYRQLVLELVSGTSVASKGQNYLFFVGPTQAFL